MSPSPPTRYNEQSAYIFIFEYFPMRDPVCLYRGHNRREDIVK